MRAIIRRHPALLRFLRVLDLDPPFSISLLTLEVGSIQKRGLTLSKGTPFITFSYGSIWTWLIGSFRAQEQVLCGEVPCLFSITVGIWAVP